LWGRRTFAGSEFPILVPECFEVSGGDSPTPDPPVPASSRHHRNTDQCDLSLVALIGPFRGSHFTLTPSKPTKSHIALVGPWTQRIWTIPIPPLFPRVPTPPHDEEATDQIPLDFIGEHLGWVTPAGLATHGLLHRNPWSGLVWCFLSNATSCPKAPSKHLGHAFPRTNRKGSEGGVSTIWPSLFGA
jgi:hypothetical protein